MFSILKKWRRKKLLSQPFPLAWLKILQHRLPYYALVTHKEQEQLQADVRVFLAEKNFEGCGGLQITDEIRVTIAAQACLLLLNRRHDYFPNLQSILVYPTAYIAPERSVDASGIVSEGVQARSGEAWLRGAIILSWDDVQRDCQNLQDGRNVTLHEFAHQLDQQDGTFDGAPLLDKPSRYSSWSRTLRTEYEALQQSVERGESSFIDAYGASNPAEFFAVITEAFFENPKGLKQKHPALYHELKQFFRQDTLARLENAS